MSLPWRFETAEARLFMQDGLLKGSVIHGIKWPQEDMIILFALLLAGSADVDHEYIACLGWLPRACAWLPPIFTAFLAHLEALL
jgi:hypothetical protein